MDVQTIKYGVKIGDLYYEHINVDGIRTIFYEVVAFKGNTQIILKQINSEIIGMDSIFRFIQKPLCGDYVKIDEDKEIEIVRSISRNSISLKGNYDTILTKVTDNREFYMTTNHPEESEYYKEVINKYWKDRALDDLLYH